MGFSEAERTSFWARRVVRFGDVNQSIAGDHISSAQNHPLLVLMVILAIPKLSNGNIISLGFSFFYEVGSKN